MELISTKSETPRRTEDGIKKRLMVYFKEYCNYSGIHGFRYIVEERTNFERMWWIISLMLSIIFCGVMIYQIFQKYINYPVIITFSMQETHLNQIPFPAVTICARAKISQDYFNLTDAVDRKFSHGSFADGDERMYNIASTICDFPSTKENNNGTDEDDIYNFLNMSRINNFLYCEYAGVEFDCDHGFTPILTEDGVCYSFNILDKGDMFYDDVYCRFNCHENLHTKEWSMEQGYSKTTSIATYPRRALRAGAKHALLIVLQTKYSDMEYECSSDESGYWVSVHLPSKFPEVLESHFTLPLNQRISGAIIPQIIKTSAGVKKFDPLKRDCYFESEKSLKFFKLYTQENCLIECQTNFTLKSCGCVEFYMPRQAETPICFLDSLLCVEEAQANFSTVNINLEILNDNGKRGTHCDCLPTCTDITYNLELSQSIFKYQPRDKNLQLEKEIHYSILNLYFKKNYIETKERNELYGFSDVVSNFGGLLGLFTGFSILSFIEIIYFLSLRIWGNIKLHGNWSGSVRQLGDATSRQTASSIC